MKTIAGLFLIIWDGLGNMFKGTFNIFGETPASVILLTSMLTFMFLTLWVYMSWFPVLIIMVITYIIIGITGDTQNENWGGIGIFLAALIAIIISVGAMIQIKMQVPNKVLITKVNLTKQNFKNEEMIINLKGIQTEVEAERECRVGTEMRIYHRTKEIYYIGDCTKCNKYVGICAEEIKREIVEVN